MLAYRKRKALDDPNPDRRQSQHRTDPTTHMQTDSDRLPGAPAIVNIVREGASLQETRHIINDAIAHLYTLVSVYAHSSYIPAYIIELCEAALHAKHAAMLDTPLPLLLHALTHTFPDTFALISPVLLSALMSTYLTSDLETLSFDIEAHIQFIIYVITHPTWATHVDTTACLVRANTVLYVYHCSHEHIVIPCLQQLQTLYYTYTMPPLFGLVHGIAALPFFIDATYVFFVARVCAAEHMLYTLVDTIAQSASREDAAWAHAMSRILFST